jgi:hypothetical protein
MSVNNRSLSPSQQCEVLHRNLGATATGVTTLIALVPYQAQVVAGGMKVFGLSGTPVYSFSVIRTVAAGLTSFGLGATVTAADGATFALGISFTAGASVLLQAGDMIALNSGVANTAITGGQLALAIKPLQDVKTYFNVVIS